MKRFLMPVIFVVEWTIIMSSLCGAIAAALIASYVLRTYVFVF